MTEFGGTHLSLPKVLRFYIVVCNSLLLAIFRRKRFQVLPGNHKIVIQTQKIMHSFSIFVSWQNQLLGISFNLFVARRCKHRIPIKDKCFCFDF